MFVCFANVFAGTAEKVLKLKCWAINLLNMKCFRAFPTSLLTQGRKGLEVKCWAINFNGRFPSPPLTELQKNYFDILYQQRGLGTLVRFVI